MSISLRTASFAIIKYDSFLDYKKGQCWIVIYVGLFITIITCLSRFTCSSHVLQNDTKLLENAVSVPEQGITTIGMELWHRYVTSS